ncbi:alpha/beta fold hydrolase [Polyangium spumosum]|uniref:Alpha/beta fold hydrolase n=1 Tax=Polyangium spumosum TaxID=889282 RepID=A0A6N7PZT4_9BACT|nr:alpha/beta hydrolase [Polyangium spumosum]MRG97057.1 alpha/beta fold hydrolase [Polyangium spumosum]
MGTIIRHTFLDSNGIRMHVTDAGRGYPILLCHGFPELWYSWRRQINALAEAGFRVLTPDLRGYGGTDAPEEIEAYVMRELVEDIHELFDALGIDKAGVVGHDWGGALAWQFALRHPERTERVCSLNAPHLAPAPVPPSIALRDAYGLTDKTYYMRHFLEPGVAERELEADVRDTFQKLMRPGKYADAVEAFMTVGDGTSLLGKIGPGETFLSKIDLDTYVRIYKRTGFRGGLSWYRALDLSWEQDKDLPSSEIELPAMLIVAEKDPLLRADLVEQLTRPHVKNLRVERLDCGHWTQQEKPTEVSNLLIDFFGDLRDPSME